MSRSGVQGFSHSARIVLAGNFFAIGFLAAFLFTGCAEKSSASTYHLSMQN